MPVTRDSTWIATEALQAIGAASVDNPASAEDLAVATDVLTSVQADLQARNIVYIPDVGNVPAALAVHMARAVALMLQPKFGQQPGDFGIPPQDAIDAALKLATSNGPQLFPMASLGY